MDKSKMMNSKPISENYKIYSMPTSDTIKIGKKPAKDSSTQRYLPFSEIRENLVIMKD